MLKELFETKVGCDNFFERELDEGVVPVLLLNEFELEVGWDASNVRSFFLAESKVEGPNGTNWRTVDF